LMCQQKLLDALTSAAPVPAPATIF